MAATAVPLADTARDTYALQTSGPCRVALRRWQRSQKCSGGIGDVGAAYGLLHFRR